MIDDAAIKIAVEADIQQFFTNSLTPDRGYGTPIDNVKKLIKGIELECATLRAEVTALRADKLRIDLIQENYTDTEFIPAGEFGEGQLREEIDRLLK